jgi:hypothetical protein
MTRPKFAIEFRTRQLGLRLLRMFDPEASTRAGIERLGSVAASPKPDARPIFVLGAGWRTGSTLVQRMINAVPGVLIWGEPYHEGALVQRLAESLSFLDPTNGSWDSWVLADGAALPSEDEWVALLTPPLESLVGGYRAMLDRLFQHPAQQQGCSRWGVKEVIWNRDCIDLLRLLYPDSRIVLLVRDPLHQWYSYRPETARPWFFRWPDQPIGTPFSFGRMWQRLVTDFVEADRSFSNVTLVKYEDLRKPEKLENLSKFLDLPEVLRSDLSRVGSSRESRFFTTDVPAWENALIRRLTAKGRSHLDYA